MRGRLIRALKGYKSTIVISRCQHIGYNPVEDRETLTGVLPLKSAVLVIIVGDVALVQSDGYVPFLPVIAYPLHHQSRARRREPLWGSSPKPHL